MSNFESMAKPLVGYFNGTRGVGHTKTVMLGFNRSPEARIIVVCEHDLPNIPMNQKIPLENLGRWLEGTRSPLVIDNHALDVMLCTGLYEAQLNKEAHVRTKLELYRVHEELDELRGELKGTKAKLEEVRKRNRQLRKA